MELLVVQVLHRALNDRRVVLAGRGDATETGEITFVLDRFLTEQTKQRQCKRGPGEDGGIIDDDLICDNVSAPVMTDVSEAE